jgi:hypothetical protein
VRGTSAIQIIGGYEKNGYIATGYYVNYASEESYIKAGLHVHIEEIDVKIENEKFPTSKMPIQLYLGSLEYYINLFDLDYKKNTRLFIGGGIIGGYENVNKGIKFLPDGRTIFADSKWIYGFTAALDLDMYLLTYGRHVDKLLSLTITPRYNYYLNSDIGNRQPNLLIGFKITF